MGILDVYLYGVFFTYWFWMGVRVGGEEIKWYQEMLLVIVICGLWFITIPFSIGMLISGRDT